MTHPPLLTIDNLSVDFDVHGSSVAAVKGISFDIHQGETLALVGESGSGKSVVAKAIMGLLPKNGRISGGAITLQSPRQNNPVKISELAVDGETMRGIRGSEISLIFQEPMVSLSPVHQIGDQIQEALVLHRPAEIAQAKQKTIEMLDMVGFRHPERAYSSYAFELSGGMRQRAMIAMALICHPALLIADEPTTALDVTIQAQILQLIKDLQQHLNMAVLMITHDLGVVANVADNVVVAYHGEIMEMASKEDLFSNPGHPYTVALCNAVPRLNMVKGERLQPLREASAKTDDLAARYSQNADLFDDDQPVLKINNISKYFTVSQGSWWARSEPLKICAAYDINLALKPGECLGLVGESGSGKSTLGKMMMRFLHPDTGNIEFRADKSGYKNIFELDDEQLLDYRRRVQYLFQDPVGSLNPSMTIFDIVREPMVIHKLCNEAEQRQRASQLMQLVGLDPRILRRYPHSFSGGQRQRISIARALALQPAVLICDEPVSALDVSIQAQILNLMKDLRRDLGVSYLFISHNMAVVNYIADRIAVLYHGKIVEIASAERIFQHASHPYTQSLLSAIPDTDLNNPLNFAALEAAGNIEANWSTRYHCENAEATSMVEIADGHWVRQQVSMQQAV